MVDADDDHTVADALVTESLTWSMVLERRTAMEFVIGERT
jgi:hypothetical protein